MVYLATPGHSWAAVQKPMAIAVEEKSARLVRNEIISDGEKGAKHVSENPGVEKSRKNNMVEEEESLGSHYERVSFDVEGKLSSDISVDR